MSLATLMKEIADSIRAKKGTDSLIKPINFPTEIASIETGGGGGASLNIEYGLTPPTDTTKLWVQTDTPTSVEIQNYLGECAVSEVLEYCEIGNPTTSSDFRNGYFNSCYIGNNQIAIVGYNRIRIFDLSSKSYVADYTISVGTSAYYSNVIYRDNVLYFGYSTSSSSGSSNLYSYDLSTQTLTQLSYFSFITKYIHFNGDGEIRICTIDGSQHGYYYKYVISTGEKSIYREHTYDKHFHNIGNHTIFANNTIYNFYMHSTVYHWKYDTATGSFTTFTSFYDFMTNLGWTTYYNSSLIYDNERYIYLIGGYGLDKATNTYISSDLIIRYDTLNDTFEVLDQKLLGTKYNHFSARVDDRFYMYGGSDVRRNLIDYFDLQYPLNNGNALITTNTTERDNNLPLINTDALKLNSNISNAYKGNVDNKAEKVNIYYYDNGWKGINCSDYTE